MDSSPYESEASLLLLSELEAAEAALPLLGLVSDSQFSTEMAGWGFLSMLLLWLWALSSLSLPPVSPYSVRMTSVFCLSAQGLAQVDPI